MQTGNATERATGPRIRRMNTEPPAQQLGSSDRCPTCGSDLAGPPIPARPVTPSIVTVDLVPDPTVPPVVGRVLALVLEAFDGRRPFPQLRTVLAVPALRYLRAAADAHRTGRTSRVRSVRVCQPVDGVAEVAAVVQIADRPRAVAARLERHAEGWQCVALRFLL